MTTDPDKLVPVIKQALRHLKNEQRLNPLTPATNERRLSTRKGETMKPTANYFDGQIMWYELLEEPLVELRVDTTTPGNTKYQLHSYSDADLTHEQLQIIANALKAV